MLAPSTVPRTLANWLRRTRLAELVSLRYMALRGWVAGSSLLGGLLQTFVFARVLSPDRFSQFILVGALGVSMWLFDLGLSKILFVELRKRYLAGEDTLPVAAQVNAVALFYALAIALAAAVCFGAAYARPSVSAWHAAEFALFFFFTALNLAWFVLRNASVAVDEYIYFETLEAWRRVGYMAALLALLAGLPFAAFVIVINLGWLALVSLAGDRLTRKRALTAQLGGLAGRLAGFFRDNWRSALRTGTHAAGEVYIHNVLYLVVPFAIGLGAPTIVLDTTLKIYFGTLNLCSAACDLLVPRQTAAYSAHDARLLKRATLAAVGLCLVPALSISALLLIDAKDLFALLLGHAAQMPTAAVPIILLLLLIAAAKSAPNFLLQHTGYFRAIARLSVVNILVMTAAVGFGLLAHLDLIGLLAVYTGAFVVIAALYIVLAIRGPLRDAAR